MKYPDGYKWIIPFLVIANVSFAMSKRPHDNEMGKSDGDKPMVVTVSEKGSSEVPLTFLDTLNRGREISLSENDFKPILPESTAVVDESKGPLVEGFRVQCFASSQIERIRSEQKQLEFKVKYPVYVVFNAPYYKLLVGDFAKRSEADFALAKLKDIGYNDAWVARCRINPVR